MTKASSKINFGCISAEKLSRQFTINLREMLNTLLVIFRISTEEYNIIYKEKDSENDIPFLLSKWKVPLLLDRLPYSVTPSKKAPRYLHKANVKFWLNTLDTIFSLSLSPSLSLFSFFFLSQLKITIDKKKWRKILMKRVYT